MCEDDPTWVEKPARGRLEQIDNTLEKLRVAYRDPQTPKECKFNNIKKDGRCFSVSATDKFNEQRGKSKPFMKDMIGTHIWEEQKMGHEPERYYK